VTGKAGYLEGTCIPVARKRVVSVKVNVVWLRVKGPRYLDIDACR